MAKVTDGQKLPMFLSDVYFHNRKQMEDKIMASIFQKLRAGEKVNMRSPARVIRKLDKRG